MLLRACGLPGAAAEQIEALLGEAGLLPSASRAFVPSRDGSLRSRSGGGGRGQATRDRRLRRGAAAEQIDGQAKGGHEDPPRNGRGAQSWIAKTRGEGTSHDRKPIVSPLIMFPVGLVRARVVGWVIFVFPLAIVVLTLIAPEGSARRRPRLRPRGALGAVVGVSLCTRSAPAREPASPNA